MSVCVSVRAYACVCVRMRACVCARARARARARVCVCVCVCEMHYFQIVLMSNFVYIYSKCYVLKRILNMRALKYGIMYR